VAIVNVDAHLDVRPYPDGRGHSGSPFRQAMEHPHLPLLPRRYVCLGAQSHSVSWEHWRYVRSQGGTVRFCHDLNEGLPKDFSQFCDFFGRECPVYVTVDADVVQAADVPGVSAPNPFGLPGREIAACARLAGLLRSVRSLDLVEVNPLLDQNHRSCRWAALVIWHFLLGLSERAGILPRPLTTECPT
jgi:formiminoglutamase